MAVVVVLGLLAFSVRWLASSGSNPIPAVVRDTIRGQVFLDKSGVHVSGGRSLYGKSHGPHRAFEAICSGSRSFQLEPLLAMWGHVGLK